MAYERTNWNNGDVISSEKLNKMEAGIEYACSLEHKVEDPTEGQVLKYDAEKEKFVNSDVPAAIETNIQNPTDGQTLKYDAASGKWVNAEGGSTSPLVIHIAGSPKTMDKTAAEIKAAYPNVVIETTDTENNVTIRILEPLTRIDISDNGYFTAYDKENDVYVAYGDDAYPQEEAGST